MGQTQSTQRRRRVAPLPSDAISPVQRTNTAFTQQPAGQRRARAAPVGFVPMLAPGNLLAQARAPIAQPRPAMRPTSPFEALALRGIAGLPQLAPPPPPPPRRPSSPYEPRHMAKGGLVRKTGVHYLHKGEVVVPAKKVATVNKALKKAGLKPLKK